MADRKKLSSEAGFDGMGEDAFGHHGRIMRRNLMRTQGLSADVLDRPSRRRASARSACGDPPASAPNGLTAHAVAEFDIHAGLCGPGMPCNAS